MEVMSIQQQTSYYTWYVPKRCKQTLVLYLTCHVVGDIFFGANLAEAIDRDLIVDPCARDGQRLQLDLHCMSTKNDVLGTDTDK